MTQLELDLEVKHEDIVREAFRRISGHFYDLYNLQFPQQIREHEGTDQQPKSRFSFLREYDINLGGSAIEDREYFPKTKRCTNCCKDGTQETCDGASGCCQKSAK